VAQRQQQIEVQKTITLMQQSPRWQSTAACADATSPQSKQFCSAYRTAEAQLKFTTAETDPQSAVLAKLSGLSAEAVRLVLAVFLAVACEVISALGLFAILPVPDLAPQREPATPGAWKAPTVISGRDPSRRDASRRDMSRPQK
jgi:hypothetical protein